MTLSVAQLLEPSTRDREGQVNSPARRCDAAGAVTEVKWHPEFDLPIAIADALGNTTTYGYNERGNVSRCAATKGEQEVVDKGYERRQEIYPGTKRPKPTALKI